MYEFCVCWSRRISFGSLLFLFIGCGGGNVPVSGVITLDGNPLPDAYVVFEPQTEGGASAASQGVTGPDGKYQLSRSDGSGDGAVIGSHRVRLTTIAPGAMADERSALPIDKIPAKYQRDSPIFDVPAGGSESANFDLKSR